MSSGAVDADQVKSIFGKAQEFAAPALRAAYVEEACGGAAALRAEVERLLAAADEAGSFMAGPALATVHHTEAYQPLTEGPGTVIGPYKLMEQIGEGGFGLVFVAEQHRPVRRKVALKIIKPGMDTRDVIARFEAERQALALMDHPNIATVFDAGATDTGRPYFVMELVRGVPITDFCDQQRLTPRDRLELFVSVCQAIQHAHQKGIIHRDVKPTNVLVTLHDGVPAVKVIDFGVAKALSQQLTERTIYTQFAQMIGTPLYMSPEQAEMSGLDIDTRSDIYSLGVLLYELLTGTTPFDRERLKRAAADEIRRIIREEEPPKPSTRISQLSRSGEPRRDGSSQRPASFNLASLAAQRGIEPAKLAKLFRGELDWIVMNCLEKDRNRRYETPNGLARDIQRYLLNEAVLACPPSTAYRFSKFARRNKVALATTFIVTASLILATAASTWQAVRATQAQRKTEVAQREAEAALAREALLRRAAEARERITRVGSLWDAGEIKQAEALLREIPAERIETEAEAFAPIIRALAHWHAGEKHWRQSAAYYHMLLFGPAKGSATVFDRLQNPPVAGATTRSALPWNLIYLEYAPLLVELGDLAGYEKLRQSAIRRYEDAFEPGVGERMLHASLLSPVNETQMATYCKWAQIARRGSSAFDFTALALFEHRRGTDEQSLEWTGRCLRASPGDGCAARAHAIAAMAYTRLNQRERAQAELDQCRSTIESKFGGRLGVGSYGGDLWADWLINRILLREADALLASPFPPDDSPAHTGAGRAAEEKRKWDEAMVRAKQELSAELAQRGDAPALDDLAWRLATDPSPKLRDGKFAVQLAERAVRIAPTVAGYWNALGVAHGQVGNFDEEIAAYREAIRIEPEYAVPHNNLLRAYNKRAWLLATHVNARFRDPERAVRMASKAVELAPTEGMYWNTLGVARYRNGEWKLAIEALSKSTELRGGGDPADWFFLAMAEWQLDNQSAAREWHKKAVEWLAAKRSVNSEFTRFRDETNELLDIEPSIAHAEANVE